MGSQRDADKRSGAGRGVGEWVTHQPRERGGLTRVCFVVLHTTYMMLRLRTLERSYCLLR